MLAADFQESLERWKATYMFNYQLPILDKDLSAPCSKVQYDVQNTYNLENKN